MANGDNNLDITVRVLTQQLGEKAPEVIKKIREETTKAAAAGVKAETEIAAATDKTFTSKKQLKDMVKQLKLDFPLLGQIGRLALNPIFLATTAVTAGFQIWNKRVAELTRSLGGIEMPDVSESAIDRVNKMASAWGDMAAKMAAAKNASGDIKRNLDDLVKTIDANAELLRAMGVDVGGQPAADKAAATMSGAAALEASGRARIARARTPGSKSSEAAELERMEATAVSAQKEMTDAGSRRDVLLKGKSLGPYDPRRLYYDNLLRIRYGYGTSYDEAIEMERGNIASSQGVVDSFGRAKAVAASREVRRSEIKAGEADITAAGGLRSQGMDLYRTAANTDMASGFKKLGGVNMGQGDILALVAETAKLAEALSLIASATGNIRRANQAAEAIRRTQ